MKTRLIHVLGAVLVAATDGTAAERLVPSQYPTIQAAVNAASNGDTVRIAAGEYAEQANVLNKTLTILGDGAAVLRAHTEMRTAPWSMNNTTILGFERANVVVSNLVFEGDQLADNYTGLFCGVVFRSSSGRLENCTIRGFNTASGSRARAVNVNNVLNNGVINLSVTGCAFAQNSLSIAFFGNDSDPATLRTRFNVQSNTFTGLGAGGSYFHAGIWIAVGAEGSIANNTIVDYAYNEPENSAVGIVANDGIPETREYFASLRPVVYSGNIFSNNSVHVHLLAANNSKITNNAFGPLAQDSTGPALGISGTNLVVADNNFQNSSEAIRLFGQGDVTPTAIPKGIARNIDLIGNWFDNATVTILRGDSVTLDEIDTQTCCFVPRFETWMLDGQQKVRARLRYWQGSNLHLDSSTDLKQWTNVGTIPVPLPVSDFAVPVNSTTDRAFFRLRAPFAE